MFHIREYQFSDSTVRVRMTRNGKVIGDCLDIIQAFTMLPRGENMTVKVHRLPGWEKRP